MRKRRRIVLWLMFLTDESAGRMRLQFGLFGRTTRETQIRIFGIFVTSALHVSESLNRGRVIVQQSRVTDQPESTGASKRFKVAS